MHEKKMKKERAKRARLFWSCARPEGSRVPNKKAFNRQKARKEIKEAREDC